MKLKTLLLGSAATLIAVSGAHAADAVVAEPEPVDYVKVCDMYGAGFFYIPGTETCLKINGFVRTQYNYSDDEDGAVVASGGRLAITAATSGAGSTTGDADVTAAVNFDAREETDLGTLRSYIRLEGDYDASFGLNDAYIELAGFGVGVRESRVVLAALPGVLFDGDADGGGDNYYAEYTFAANGFSLRSGVMIGVGTAFEENVDPFARIDYSGGMWAVAASAAYDVSAEETFYSVYGSIAPVDGLTLLAYFSDATGSNRFSESTGSETQNYGVGVWYAWDAFAVGGGYYHYEENDVDAWTVGFDWQIVPNLKMRLGYQSFDGDPGVEGHDYRIRLQRDF